MVAIVVFMLCILLVAAVVVLYVAFPHRGEAVPGAPWLGAVMSRAAHAVPTLEGDEGSEGRILR